MQTRRLPSALVGGLLLLSTLVEVCRGSYGFYQEYYLIPKEKYGVLTPLRWQDLVFMAAFWLVAMALVYLSYRLLKYTLLRKPGGEPRVNASDDL